MRWLTVTVLAEAMVWTLTGCNADQDSDTSGSDTKQSDGSDSKPAPPAEQPPSGSGSR